jgi:hypothetical protein
MFAATQKYIPGLNQRPPTPPEEAIPASKIPKEVRLVHFIRNWIQKSTHAIQYVWCEIPNNQESILFIFVVENTSFQTCTCTEIVGKFYLCEKKKWKWIAVKKFVTGIWWQIMKMDYWIMMTKFIESFDPWRFLISQFYTVHVLQKIFLHVHIMCKFCFIVISPSLVFVFMNTCITVFVCRYTYTYLYLSL